MVVGRCPIGFFLRLRSLNWFDVLYFVCKVATRMSIFFSFFYQPNLELVLPIQYYSFNKKRLGKRLKVVDLAREAIQNVFIES